jgi:hypothetical protein
MDSGGLERDPPKALDSARRHRRLALSGAALLAAVAVGIGAAFLVQSRLHDSGSAAPAVEEGKLEEILAAPGTENDVLKAASSRAGFLVKPVDVFATRGRRLEGVVIQSQPGLPTSVRLRYVLNSKDGEFVNAIFVEEHNLRFSGPMNEIGGNDPAHPDPTRKLDLGVEGVEIWDSGGGPTTFGYTLFTKNRTYYIIFRGGRLTEDELKAAALAVR